MHGRDTTDLLADVFGWRTPLHTSDHAFQLPLRVNNPTIAALEKVLSYKTWDDILVHQDRCHQHVRQGRTHDHGMRASRTAVLQEVKQVRGRSSAPPLWDKIVRKSVRRVLDGLFIRKLH